MGRTIVIGAGIAGLRCAGAVHAAGHAAGHEVLLLEASDRVGGRVATDRMETERGVYLLDRGFQVLLDSYEHTREVMSFSALRLRAFEPGALVWDGQRMLRLADPWRRPIKALAGLARPVLPMGDVPGVLRLRKGVQGEPDCATIDTLRQAGISDRGIDRFFRPFFSGVFLERELSTPAAMFRFVFERFAQGSATLPERGMGAIPEQLASRLPTGAIRLGTPVERIEPGRVEIVGGESLHADHIVVATPAPIAGRPDAPLADADWNSTVCVYFDAEQDPVREPTLVLNAVGDGPINHLAVLSGVQSSYAPHGRHLISASIVGRGGRAGMPPIEAVREQLRGWFGRRVETWTHLKTVHIAHALPRRFAQAGTVAPGARLAEGLYVAGDTLHTPSIEGAMLSGSRAADAILTSGTGGAAA
ncbi:MAG: FAD-dependent oxidoreductase [Planctomycetota bacterium]